MFCKSRKARCTQGPQGLGTKGASRLWACGQRAFRPTRFGSRRGWWSPLAAGRASREDLRELVHGSDQRQLLGFVAGDEVLNRGPLVGVLAHTAESAVQIGMES